MTVPWYETVRIKHPNIPDSEHDVPKDSLFIMERSGWVIATQEPEDTEQPKEEKTTASASEDDKKEDTKKSSSASGATKKEASK